MQSWRDQLRRREVQIGAAVVGVLAVIIGVAVVAASSSNPEYGKLPPAATATRSEDAPSAATPPAEGTPFRLLTPGPTIPAGHWRWSGSVIDENSAPLPGVCVHIGPGDCRFNSVRTDEQGRWVIDFPQVDVIYEFHFIKEGYQQVDETIRTQGPGELRERLIPKK
jgi:hypothetical protein